MKRTGAKATDAKRTKDASKKEGSSESETLNLSIEQIEDRAFTQTEVLVGILERQEGPYLRHWGLNE